MSNKSNKNFLYVTVRGEVLPPELKGGMLIARLKPQKVQKMINYGFGYNAEYEQTTLDVATVWRVPVKGNRKKVCQGKGVIKVRRALPPCVGELLTYDLKV